MNINELHQLHQAGKLAPGKYSNITDEIYFDKDCPGVSRSDLLVVKRSVRHYLEGKKSVSNSETPALIFGKAFHCALLTPDQFDKYFCPEFEGPAALSKRTKEYQSLKEAYGNQNIGRHQLDAETMLRLKTMVDACKEHPVVAQLLKLGEHENVFFWEDEGVLCRAKIDTWVPSKGLVVDFKTTTDASLNSFRKSIANYYYDMQGAFYVDGVSAYAGAQIENYLIVAVESQPPHEIAVYHLLSPDLEVGRELYKTFLRKLKNANAEGEHLGYPKEIQAINLPAFGYDTGSRI